MADINQDPLVDGILPDPARPQETTVLIGFLGRSPAEGRWRIYLSEGLNEYAEVAADDIVHTRPIPEQHSPLGGTIVWVKKGAAVAQGATRPQETQAEMLQGNIAGTYSGAQAPWASLASPVPTPHTTILGCGRTALPYCPTPPVTILGCGGTVGQLCPTHFCPSTNICPTLAACPTHYCPSTHVCPSLQCPTNYCPSTHICPTLACPTNYCPSTHICPSHLVCPTVAGCPPPLTIACPPPVSLACA